MASSVVLSGKYAIPGDMLVLTKPLGTGVATKIRHWWLEDPAKRKKLELVVKEEELMECLNFADYIIKIPHDPILELMPKYRIHAATQVSSEGILGHASNLAKFQNSSVDFVLHNIPVIKKMDDLCHPFSYEPDVVFQLEQGRSPEVAGGLLIAMPREDAVYFCQKLDCITGFPAWIVGTVNYGTGKAKLHDRALLLNIFREDRELPDMNCDM